MLYGVVLLQVEPIHGFLVASDQVGRRIYVERLNIRPSWYIPAQVKHLTIMFLSCLLCDPDAVNVTVTDHQCMVGTGWMGSAFWHQGALQ